MSTDYEGLVQALKTLFQDILEQKRNYKAAILGDGNGNVDVPGRPDYVYVRLSSQSIRVSQIFNKRVSGVDGTPVLVGELPWQPGVEQVVTIDWAAYAVQEWGNDYNGVPAHAPSHSYQSEATHGGDPVLVYQPAIQPLKVTGDGVSLTVSVAAYRYQFGGIIREFPGGSVNMTPYIPSAGNVVAVLVSLKKSTGVLSVTAGSEILDLGVQPPYPTIPTDDVAAGYVILSASQTVINNTDIVDARDFLGGGGTASLPTGENGQVLYNDNGTFIVATPVVDSGGWLVDETTGNLIIDV